MRALDLARPRRHERARQPVGEELLVRRGAPLGADVLPPALLLPLLQPALVARREQRQQPLDEQRELVRRDAELRRRLAREPHAAPPRSSSDDGRVRDADRARCARRPARAAIRVAWTRLSATPAARRTGSAAIVSGQVAVEAGEEAEAVLGRADRRARRRPSPDTGIERALPPNARAPRTRVRRTRARPARARRSARRPHRPAPPPSPRPTIRRISLRALRAMT